MFSSLIIYKHLLSYLNCRSRSLGGARVLVSATDLQPLSPLHPPASPRSRHNRCRVKKAKKNETLKKLNEKISKSYVYRKAPHDETIQRGSLCSFPSQANKKNTAWATCVLLIQSMSVHRQRLLLLLQRRRRSHQQDTHDSSPLGAPACSRRHTGWEYISSEVKIRLRCL